MYGRLGAEQYSRHHIHVGTGVMLWERRARLCCETCGGFGRRLTSEEEWRASTNPYGSMWWCSSECRDNDPLRIDNLHDKASNA